MNHQLELPFPSPGLLSSSTGRPANSPLSLTPRRRRVLVLYLSGYQRKQIARLLEVSPNTVRNHIQEIYDALGISNKIEALRWALAQPIIAEQLLNPSSEGPGYHSATEPGGTGSTSATMEGAVGEATAYFQRQVIESPMVVPQW